MCAPPSRRMKRSVRSRKATARWSAADTAFFPSPRKRGEGNSGPIMFEIFGIPSNALFGQLLIGLINGSFYALLSLGLAVIFGMLNIINFSHGAQYMMGAFAAYLLLQYSGIGYWPALIVAPVLVGITGMIVERLFLQWLYKLDHLYGLLLTFGLALIIEGVALNHYGSAGMPYTVPESLQGGRNLGFMFLPNYRAWVIVASLTICIATWFVIERTRLGAQVGAEPRALDHEPGGDADRERSHDHPGAVIGQEHEAEIAAALQRFRHGVGHAGRAIMIAGHALDD